MWLYICSWQLRKSFNFNYFYFVFVFYCARHSIVEPELISSARSDRSRQRTLKGQRGKTAASELLLITILELKSSPVVERRTGQVYGGPARCLGTSSAHKTWSPSSQDWTTQLADSSVVWAVPCSNTEQLPPSLGAAKQLPGTTTPL